MHTLLKGWGDLLCNGQANRVEESWPGPEPQAQSAQPWKSCGPTSSKAATLCYLRGGHGFACYAYNIPVA